MKPVRGFNTPYHHLARVKGIGVDCATFIADVYEQAGVLGHIDVEYYPQQWHLHQEDERYMDAIKLYMKEVDEPEIGDTVLFKYGRAFAHSGILIEKDKVIHVDSQNGTIITALFEEPIGSRKKKFFSPWKMEK